MEWYEQVEEVVGHVLDLLARRPGSLAEVTVSVPPDLSRSAVSRALGEGLARGGHEVVRIVTLDAEGPLRLISLELVR